MALIVIIYNHTYLTIAESTNWKIVCGAAQYNVEKWKNTFRWECDPFSYENASLELFLNTFHRLLLLIIFAG